MQHSSLVVLAILGCVAVLANGAEQTAEQPSQLKLLSISENADRNESAMPHARAKRTLFLKKKLLGAGLLGFGLGAVKGYKFGYHSAPEVHHVYVAPPPPPVKYVEYVEKPVFVPHVVEKPVFKPHVEYEPAWSPPEPSPVYGSW